jgi:hypothetical protein
MTEERHESKPEKEAEKNDEKEREKEQEKTRGGEEKRWDEKGRRDPFGTTLWGLIVLWAGLVLLASNLGWLGPLSFVTPWSLILLGAGAILLLGVLFTTLVPVYRRPVGGLLILGVLLLAAGLGASFGALVLGPALLIGLGVLILWRAVKR